MSDKIKKKGNFRYKFWNWFFENKNDQEPNPFRGRTGRILMYLSLGLLVLFIALSASVRLIDRERVLTQPQEELARYQEQLAAMQSENEALTNQNELLNQEFTDARLSLFSSIDTAAPENQEVLNSYRLASVFAGMTEHKGSGIRVVMQDKEGIQYDQTTKSTEIIHDADIRYIVNWFKSNQAVAIAVNQERLSPMSPLICTGPAVLVNRVYKSMPFVIEAACDAESLRVLLAEDPGIQQMMSRGLRISITAEPELTIAGQQDMVYVNEQVRKLGGNE